MSPGALYGKAIEMVGYSTDGEGTDWMFGEKEIISFSPELGSLNSDALPSQRFDIWSHSRELQSSRFVLE